LATQPKPGVPESIEIGVAVLEQMMGPILFWQVFGIALWSPIEITTASLCSSLPDPREDWGAQDMIGYFDPELRPLLTEKLIRMVKANLWNTYCEVIPDEPQIGNGLVWQRVTSPEFPFYTGVLDYTGGVFHDQPQITYLNAHSALADALMVYTRCVDPPSENSAPARPAYTYVNGTTDYPIGPGDGSGVFTSVGGTEKLTVYWPSSLPTGRFVEGDSLQLHGPELGGSWVWQAWFVRLVAAQLPDPSWPVPATALATQLTQAQLDALILMTNEWTSHRVTTAILPGMVTEVLDTVNARADQLVALLEGLAVEPLGGFASDADNHLVEESASFDVPAGVVGFYVFVENAPHATVLGSNPEAFFEVGFVAQAWGEAFYESQPIKHNPTLFYPLKPQVEHIWFDLWPNTQVSFNWLVPT
jgi:hypothetical protein